MYMMTSLLFLSLSIFLRFPFSPLNSISLPPYPFPTFFLLPPLKGHAVIYFIPVHKVTANL